MVTAVKGWGPGRKVENSIIYRSVSKTCKPTSALIQKEIKHHIQLGNRMKLINIQNMIHGNK